jgi:hypothetical protein
VKKSKKLVWWLVGIAAVLLLGAALWGPIVSNVEQPKYTVVERSANIEIRDYAPMIVAEAEVKGERREAINEGFRIIADYIVGQQYRCAESADDGSRHPGGERNDRDDRAGNAAR